jgi:dGTPase
VRYGSLTRRIIGGLVAATLDETSRRLEAIGANPTPDDVRAQAEPVVSLPDAEEEQVGVMIGFLLQRVYRHPSVEIMCDKGRRLLRALFEHFVKHPGHLPRAEQERLNAEGDRGDPRHVARIVLDFLAGTTDRHAVLLYQQVFTPTSPLLPYID